MLPRHRRALWQAQVRHMYHPFQMVSIRDRPVRQPDIPFPCASALPSIPMIEEDTGTRPDPSPPSASLVEAFQTCAKDLQRFLAGKVSCEAAAADLAQEIYLRVVRSDPTLSVADPRSYLFRIANNLAIDHLRSQRRRRSLPHDAPEALALPDRRASSETAYLAKEELDVVCRAMTELSPLCRRIFMLNRFEGRSHLEITEALGISKSTVEKNVARALNHFRRAFGRRARPSVPATSPTRRFRDEPS